MILKLDKMRKDQTFKPNHRDSDGLDHETVDRV
jgi:hypothetical protein